MARKARTLAATQAQEIVHQVAEGMALPAEGDVFEEAIAERQAAEAASHAPAPQPEAPPESNGHAAQVGKKEYKPAPNPRSWASQAAGTNRIQLLRRDPVVEHGREVVKGAYIIRFEKPPNEMPGHSKENPHPVLAYLKSEGFKWAFDEMDDKGGHGKLWEKDRDGRYIDPFGADKEIAERVMAKAAEMVGAEVNAGQGR